MQQVVAAHMCKQLASNHEVYCPHDPGNFAFQFQGSNDTERISDNFGMPVLLALQNLIVRQLLLSYFLLQLFSLQASP